MFGVQMHKFPAKIENYGPRAAITTTWDIIQFKYKLIVNYCANRARSISMPNTAALSYLINNIVVIIVCETVLQTDQIGC